MHVLVVVPTLNEASNIERVVKQLLQNVPEGLVLVVVDGGSSDGTGDIVQAMASRDPRICLVSNPAKVQSAGVNRAVAQLGAGADVMIRADAHADYPAGYIACLLAEQRRTGAAAVTVGLESRARSGFAAGAAAAQNSFLGTGGSAHRCGAASGWVDHGHHALFRLDAFRAVGGYDEEFRHNEDAELDYRLLRAGFRIWLTDSTHVVYHPRQTAPALWRQYLNYGYGRASMLRKHRLRPKLRQALPLTIVPASALAVAGVSAAAATASIAPLVLTAPVSAWAAVCLGFGAILSARSRRVDALWAGPAAIVSQAAWALGFWLRLMGQDRVVARRDIRVEAAHGG